MTVRQNSLKAWMLAARPKTLTGALIPVILGSALAYHNGMMQPLTALCCALFAGFMQIAANMINDLYDFQKGTDREDRLGPERACAQGWITPKAMQRGIAVVIAFASLSGLAALALCWQQLPYHGIELAGTGILCIIFAFLYTYGLSYIGLGDLLVLVFFGLIPVCGTYYVQANEINLPSVLLGLVSGISIEFGLSHYLLIAPIASLLAILFANLIDVYMLYMLIVVTIYWCLHLYTWIKMRKIHTGKALNRILGETSRNMFIFALLLALAIIL